MKVSRRSLFGTTTLSTGGIVAGFSDAADATFARLKNFLNMAGHRIGDEYLVVVMAYARQRTSATSRGLLFDVRRIATVGLSDVNVGRYATEDPCY
jgi:hypothetical protein